MRRDFETSHQCKPIQGAKFTFRTLHGPDARYGGRSKHNFSMDREVTITLPAIDGELHKMVPCMQVEL